MSAVTSTALLLLPLPLLLSGLKVGMMKLILSFTKYCLLLLLKWRLEKNFMILLDDGLRGGFSVFSFQ